MRAASVAVALCLSASPVAAQILGTVAPALTPQEVAASEALAPKYDQSVARERARQEVFRNRPLGGVIQRTFDVFSNYILMAAEMMPESSYGFRPTPDVRTFGEQINHATGAHYSFCGQAGMPPGVTRQSPPNLREVTAKAEIVQALRASIAYCDGVLAAATEAWLMEVVPRLGGSSSGLIEGIRAHAFIYNAAHTTEDYGTITTYLRMQRIVPPSTALHPPVRR